MIIMKQLFIATLLTAATSTPVLAAKFVTAPTSATTPVTTTPTTTSAPTPTIVSAAPSPVVTQVTPAHAAQKSTGTSGTYIGAQLGDSTIGALLGYQISKMFAMEISYDYVDPIYKPPTTLEKSRAGISGLALFPIKFNDMGPMAIYVKVGYGRTTEKLTLDDPGLGIGFPPTTTVTTTIKTGVTGGAGIHVDLSNNTSARLGVSAVGDDKSAYLAVLYKF